MKKAIFVILLLALLSILAAHHLTPVELKNGLKINYGGDYRVRGILYNDFNKNDGGWFDNRLQLDFNTMVTDKLGLTWNIAAGDIIWGDADTGGGFYTRGVNLKTREMFLDYNCNLIPNLNLRTRMGQQYWSDPTSLILDDDFSGITFDTELSKLVLEAGFIKAYEGRRNKLDDAHYGFVNAMIETPVNAGVFAMYGVNNSPDFLKRTADIWVMPYINATFKPVDLKLAAVINNQSIRDNLNQTDSEMGIGFSAKANVDIGLNLGGNLLYVSENGLDSLSPYYTNGLVIFGINSDFDTSCIGWGTDSYGAIYNSGEGFLSLVGTASYTFKEKANLFAAGGFLTRDDPVGMEGNVGIDYEIAPDVHLITIGAAGISGKSIESDYDGDNNMVYFFGSQIKAAF
jgi:hypothetical protein